MRRRARHWPIRNCKKALLERGSKAVGISPDDLKAFMTSEYKRWGDIVRAAGAKAE